MTQEAPLDPALSPTLPPRSDDRGLGGLLALIDGAERPLPLQHVQVRASVAGFAASVVVEQTFENPHEQPLEVVHLFPVSSTAAVVGFELRAGEVHVVGECQPKATAQAAFDEAKAQGHRAGLLTRERDDVHTVRVTNLPPKTTVRVRIEVVEALELSDGRFEWRFPTTIAPRYLTGLPTGQTGPGVLPNTDHVPDASHVQPPLRLTGGTTLDLQVTVAGPVRDLESTLHAVRMDLDAGVVRVSPSGRATLNSDFVIRYGAGDDAQIGAKSWTDGAHTVVVVAPPALAFPDQLPRDATFIVDISGSMGGSKMDAAKRAIHAALHGLMPGDRFRLIAFDDRLETFDAGRMQDNTPRNLAKADKWVSKLGARGGTEMLPALRKGLELQPPAGRLGTVLFITDGQAWNEAELVAAVANRRGANRLFTLGIDTAPNESLLGKLARAGGGHRTLAAPGADVDAVIADIENRFGSPLLTDLQVAGQASPGSRVVYAGRPALLLVDGAPDTVTVQATGPSGPVTLTCTPSHTDTKVGPLYGRRRVEALEDRLVLKPFEEEALLPEIERVAMQFGIVSRATSFVAVDRSVTVDRPAHTVVQPHELPAEWETQAGGGGPRGGAVMASAPGAMPPPAPMAQGAPMPKRRKMVSRSRAGGVMDRLFGGRKKSAPEPACEAEEMDDEGALMDAMPAQAPMPVAKPAPTPRREQVKSHPRSTDLAGTLARSQGADGSFGGDVARTVAALVALVVLGHTRRTGLRRRTALKAAKWLQGRSESLAVQALAWLADAESGTLTDPKQFICSGPEGEILRLVT